MTIVSTATVCFGSNNNMPGDPDKSPGFGKRLKAIVTKLRGDLVKRARNAPRPPLNLVKLAGLGVLGIFLYRYAHNLSFIQLRPGYLQLEKF